MSLRRKIDPLAFRQELRAGRVKPAEGRSAFTQKLIDQALAKAGRSTRGEGR